MDRKKEFEERLIDKVPDSIYYLIAADGFTHEDLENVDPSDIFKIAIQKTGIHPRSLEEAYYLIDDYPEKGVEYAAKHGFFNTVKAFLSQDPSYAKEALIAASQEGHLEIVQYILPEKLHQTTLDKAFIEASDNGHLEIVDLLLQNGADINSYNCSALSDASRRGDLEMVRFLVKKGIDLEQKGTFALVVSSGNGHLPIVRFLVEEGVDVKKAQFMLGTPLRNALENFHGDIANFLIENGANIKNDALSVLYSSIYYDHLDLVRFLIENEYVDVNRKEDGKSPLIAASRTSHLSIVRYLVENGADIERDGNYSLVQACLYGRLPVVRYLVENGAQITDDAIIKAQTPEILEFLESNI